MYFVKQRNSFFFVNERLLLREAGNVTSLRLYLMLKVIITAVDKAVEIKSKTFLTCGKTVLIVYGAKYSQAVNLYNFLQK